MKEDEKRTQRTEGGPGGRGNEAAQQLHYIRLPLNQLRAYLRTRQVPQGLIPEQRTAFASIEEAIETYVGFLYAPGSRP
jgi:hypothetical protein